MRKLTEWFKAYRTRRVAEQRRLAIARIRATFAMFGHDLSALSDEEVERALQRTQHEVKQWGIPLEDAAKSLSAFQRSIKAVK